MKVRPAANTALVAQHLYVCGNTGTGKSSRIKEKIKTAKRVIAFDPDDEYSELSGFKRVTQWGELVALLKTHQNKPLKVAFVAEGKEAFEFWCNCAFNWRDCIAIAEEIADVTTAAKAPPAWGRLIRRGRKYAILICAVTQRPAEADKTIMTNAAVIRVCALGRFADRKAIANEIQCDIAEIEALKPLDWLEYKRGDLSLIKGRLGTKRVTTLRQAV